MRTFQHTNVEQLASFKPPKLSAAGYAAATFVMLISVLPAHAPAAPWDLATAPLETSGASSVKPNIFFILDDSGSMNWDFMPDWADDTCDSDNNNCTEELVRNSGYNATYYNPAITYAPPLNYDGTSRISMTAANTNFWKKVPFDAYGIQEQGNVKNTGLNNIITFPNSASGKTWQNLSGSANYYTFVAGEYCTTPNLSSCVTQSALNNTHPLPALLRWCKNSALTDCQVSRIDGSYDKAKYPGQGGVAPVSAESVLTFSQTNTNTNKTVNKITVDNGKIILAAPQSNSNLWNLAKQVENSINACTTVITGNCTVSGYSAVATSTGWITPTIRVTITAPDSLGNITYTPVVTKSGSVNIAPASFTGGASGTPPIGSNTLTTITLGNTYPKAKGRIDCAGSVCTYDEEMTNFANWWAYYHTRMQMAKSAISTAFASLDNRYRLGYMSINNSTASGNDFLNIADITTASNGQKDLWFAKIANANPSGGTALRSALSTAGRIYAGKLTGNQALWGSNGAQVNVTDPMQYSCQRNFTLLSTDGYWNASSAKGTQINGTTAVGNQDGSETGAALDRKNNPDTLADVAQYYYATDIRDSAFSNEKNLATNVDVSSNDVADLQQRMYTSTLGLGASGYMLYQDGYDKAKSGDFFDVKAGTSTNATTAAAGICAWQTSGNCTWPTPVGDKQTTIDDLWHAAVNGRGVYYSAKDPASVQSSLTDFLNNVTASTSSSAAATTSNPNVSTGDNYVFKSTFRSGSWYGELARYTLDLTNGALSANADWAQSGIPFKDVATQTLAPPLMDDRLYSDRKIYTNNPSSNVRIDFDWSSLDTAGLSGYFKLAAIGNGSAPLQPLTQLCSSGVNCLDATAQADSTTAGTTTGAGGINLVNYLRGDRSNEGPDATTYYFQRTHVLGDIVDSQAVYVKAPLWSYNDAGYTAFKSAQANRQGTVYVGANDGMLHAFNADNGSESWAYIPSMLLPNLYKLADKKYSANHAYYVNATPKTGDVYTDGTGGTGTGATWKTILIGGLGRGGRGYYALDITNPASPSVLWEFKHTTDPDLGYTYGTPIITKLSDGTWVVLVTSGYNNVSPGSGKGIVWVLNAATGAIIKKIDTGMGSATTTVAGCTSAPCPSGLSKISAYVDSSRSNNLALRIYGGDLYGNVWRVDLSKLTAAGGSAYVQLLATLSSDANGISRQPVTTRPEVSYINNQPVVYVGTGAYLGPTDVSNTNKQTIYAIKDPVPLSATTTTLAGSSASTATYANPRASTCTASTNTNCFVKQTLTDAAGVRKATSTVSYAADFATMNGWYADMPQTGERIDTDPDLQLGTLAFTSNKPATNDPCSAGGSSYLNYFDYKTGGAVPGTTTVGVSLSTGSTSALATAVTMIRLPSGKVVGVSNLSDGSSVTKGVNVRSSGTGTRRVTWRELIN